MAYFPPLFREVCWQRETDLCTRKPISRTCNAISALFLEDFYGLWFTQKLTRSLFRSTGDERVQLPGGGVVFLDQTFPLLASLRLAECTAWTPTLGLTEHGPWLEIQVLSGLPSCQEIMVGPRFSPREKKLRSLSLVFLPLQRSISPPLPHEV